MRNLDAAEKNLVDKFSARTVCVDHGYATTLCAHSTDSPESSLKRFAIVLVAAAFALAPIAAFAADGPASPSAPPSASTPAQPQSDAGAPAKPKPLLKDVIAATPVFGDISSGSETAKVVVVEYASLSCPHCAVFHTTVWPEIKKKYVDTGKVRWIFRDMILGDKFSIGEAMLVRCSVPSKYRQIVDVLYTKQKDIFASQEPAKTLLAIMAEWGMDESAVKSCFTDEKVFAGLKGLHDNAINKFGVPGTPAFFIGDEMLVGEQAVEDMEKRLDALLAN